MKKQPDFLTQQLVTLTFSDLETVAAWARRIGLEVEVTQGCVRLRNHSLNMVTAFVVDTDPVNRAVCLGLATAGTYWPWTYPELLKWVNLTWDEQRKGGENAN